MLELIVKKDEGIKEVDVSSLMKSDVMGFVFVSIIDGFVYVLTFKNDDTGSYYIFRRLDYMDTAEGNPNLPIKYDSKKEAILNAVEKGSKVYKGEDLQSLLVLLVRNGIIDVLE